MDKYVHATFLWVYKVRVFVYVKSKQPIEFQY